ncbi:hypothetical protein D3C85_1106100 [compost metagenome]
MRITRLARRMITIEDIIIIDIICFNEVSTAARVVDDVVFNSERITSANPCGEIRAQARTNIKRIIINLAI